MPAESRGDRDARTNRAIDLIATDEQLNLSRPVADVDEDQLSLLPLQHNTAGRANHGAMRLGATFSIRGARDLAFTRSD